MPSIVALEAVRVVARRSPDVVGSIEAETRTCAACGHVNGNAARFCAQCGARLLDVGTDVAALARFCTHCGQPLATASPALASPGAYTPKHLADKILTSRTALEGERKQVTVLFADVENFTRLGERLDPEELHELMDRVFAVLLDAIHRYEGTVNQFTGDGVMALFGAPVALEDHAVRAVAAALDVQAMMSARAEEFRAVFGTAPMLRIGINTGRVVVGKIGDDLRMDYTAQGDTVNLAARLQALAEAGTVAMSVASQRLVAGAVESLSLGLHRVKGKADPVEVFRPLRLRSAALEDLPADALTPFVGRETELETLLGWYHDAARGAARVALVIGEAGIGKSRLLHELRRRTQPVPDWFVGHCVPYGRAAPYRPIVDIVRTMLGLSEGDSEDVAEAKIEQALAQLGDEAPSQAPALRWLLAIGPPDPTLAVLSPGDRKAAITRALDLLIGGTAARCPLVLVVDACQWLDAASEEYLDGAARRLHDVPLFLALTCRPDDHGRVTIELAGSRLQLRPLAGNDARTLVRRIAPDLSPEVIEVVAERTGGNPLFLTEVTRTVLETGTARVPPSIEDVLMARIDRLPPRVKGVLQTTAVIGRQFSRALLARVLDDPTPLDGALDALLGLGLIHRADGADDMFTCDQPLIHEVTYEGLLNQQRKALHRRIGETLETTMAHRLVEHVEDLAHHFARAEEWPRALGYHREAGRKAAGLCANDQAVRWFQRALEIVEKLPEEPETVQQTIEILLDLCRAMVQLGNLGEVLRLTQSAESLARKIGDDQRLGDVYAYVSNYHYMKGEPDQAIRYGQLCLSLGDQSESSRTRRAARQYLGTSYHVLGEYPMAEELLSQQVASLATAEGVDQIGPVNLAYVASSAWLAFTLAELGEFRRAREAAGAGLQAANRAGHPYARAIATSFAGLVCHVQGDVEEAVPLFETSFALCAEHSLQVWRPLAAALLGHASVVHGKVERGLELLWESAELNERLGVVAYRALWMTYLAEALIAGGQVDKALEIAEKAIQFAVQHKEQGNATRALQVLGMVLTAMGPSGYERAGERLRQALEQAERLRMRPLVAVCYGSLARLARKQGDEETAVRFADTAAELSHALGMRFWSERASAG